MMQLKMMQDQGIDAAIIALFSAGEKGAWYDPSDISTMFQDTAGATPVTDTGQPVGRINDKSGNGRDLLQGTAGNKPTLEKDSNDRYYLSFDGADDGMSYSSFDMSTNDGLSIFSAASKLSETAIGTLVELSSLFSASNGTFLIGYPSAVSAQNCLLGSKGTTAVFPTKTALATGTSPRAIIALSKISTPTAEIRIDDLSAVTVTTTQGTGNFGNHDLYVGRRAGTSNPFHGRLYSLVIRSKYSTESEIAAAKEYIKYKGAIA